MNKKNKTAPKVTVITPIYNTPLRSIRVAIESILNQTFTDFEYLILNDSPNNKKLDEAVLSYKDSRITYIKNDKNLGLEASTNKLIGMSRGEYIAIFDHDDISLPERLAKEVEYLDKHPSTGVVSAQFEVFGKKNVVSNNPIDSKSIRKKLLLASAVSHTTVMYRKSVINKYNIRYEEDFFPASSYRILTRLSLVTDIYNLPDMLLRYRMDGNNTSIKHAERRVEARKRIQNEHGVGLVNRIWQKNGNNLDSVKLVGISPIRSFQDCRYYKAKKDGQELFIKAEAKQLSNEYNMAKEVYDVDKKYVIEPIAYYSDEYDYLAMRWSDGVTLEEYLKSNTLIDKQKTTFIHDLYEISKLLRKVGIVHRDITPKNLLVINDRIKLIDFHFAVKYDDYKEIEFLKQNITKLGMMGQPFCVGVYKWDDAYSLTKIAELVAGCDDASDKYLDIQKIAKHIDERPIVPDGALLREVIIWQRDMLRQRDAALAMFNVVRRSIFYRAARKAYHAVKKRKTSS